MARGIPKSIQTVGSLSQRKPLSAWQILLFTVSIILIVSVTPVSDWIKRPLLFVTEPFYYFGQNIGKSASEFFSLFSSIGDLQNENANLVEENGTLLSESALAKLLIEENRALSKELSLGDREKELQMAEVVYYEPAGYMTINLGSNDGLKVNDIAKIGNVYVGRVVEVNSNYSKVRTVLSKESTLAVEISQKVKGDLTVAQIRDKYADIKKDSVSGATLGGQSNILIEGISQNAQIAIGDGVIVNDEKVGSYLVIGVVETIGTDPASTEKTVTVKPIYNYNELTYIYIYSRN